MAAKVDWEKKLGPVAVRLRPNLHFTRQAIRGDPTYVVHDPLTFKNHVFRLQEYRVMTSLIHGRTLQDTFAHLVATSVLGETDKAEYYEFILVLHRMHLLKLPISDPELLFERYLWRIEQKRRRLLTMLISYKVPLCDPDRFLDRTVRYVSFLFSPAGLAGWACLVLFAVWNLWGRFEALFAELDDILAFANLPLLWIILVVLKALHELGHAFACKRLGGEVPEMGAMILLATPCAYVDASASWKFASKWHRIGVAMAGMYVESFVAALFAIVWVSTQQSLLHEIARNVMVLAGASTVLFNANPLMKYDGYYVLTDLADVPNLRERAAAFLRNGAKRLFLGICSPPDAEERKHRSLYLWFGAGSTIYRFLLTISIAVMVIMQWPVVGISVALLLIVGSLGGPIVKLFAYLLRDAETAPVRWRARLLSAGLVAAVPALVFLLPVSFHVVVPGVLEPERSLVVRAPAAGFVTDVMVGHSGGVDAGGLLLRMDNPDLRFQHDSAVFERTAEAVLLSTVEVTDLTKAAQHRARLESIDFRVATFGRKLGAMQLRAETGGVIGTWHPESLRGRYCHEGEPLLEIQSARYLVHVILTEEQIQLAGLEVGDLTDLRWSSDPTVRTRAVVEEIRPVVSREEVPPALTMLAGGEIPIRPELSGRTSAERPYLHVLLAPQDPLPLGMTGMTARVRLGGRIETLGSWLRRKALTLYQAWQIAG